MTTGGNNSYVGKKYGDMFNIVPMPLEITQQVTPVSVINPPLFPVITSEQHRGLPQIKNLATATQTGAGTVIGDFNVPNGRYWRIYGLSYYKSGGTATLTNYSIQIQDPVGTTYYSYFSTTDPAGNPTTHVFPTALILPQGWLIRIAIVLSAANAAVYQLNLMTQDWAGESQDTTQREGLF